MRNLLIAAGLAVALSGCPSNPPPTDQDQVGAEYANTLENLRAADEAAQAERDATADKIRNAKPMALKPVGAPAEPDDTTSN